MFRLIRSIEDLTKALNRLVDSSESSTQRELDALVQHFKRTNDRLNSKLQTQKTQKRGA